MFRQSPTCRTYAMVCSRRLGGTLRANRYIKSASGYRLDSSTQTAWP